MAIKFKGDTTVAIINSIKKAEVDTVYRCFDSGVLLSNEVINHGDFVSWDGTKWLKRPDLSYLLDDAGHPTESQIEDIQADIDSIEEKIPSGASSSNKFVTESGMEDALSTIGTGYTPKGNATVATLAELTGQSNGDMYIVTDSGTLNDGTLAVSAGDTVAWDSENEVWYKVNQYATTTYAQNVAHSIAPEFNPTRNYVVGDDCTSEGTAYIFTSDHPAGAWNPAHATISGQKALLQLTAQNALTENAIPANFQSSIAYTDEAQGYYDEQGVLKTSGGTRFLARKYVVSGDAGYTIRTNMFGYMAVCEFDENDNFIKSHRLGSDPYDRIEFITDVNCSYLWVSTDTNVSLYTGVFDNAELQLDKNLSVLNDAFVADDVLGSENGYYRANGTFVSSANLLTLEYSVEPSTQYSWVGDIFGDMNAVELTSNGVVIALHQNPNNPNGTKEFRITTSETTSSLKVTSRITGNFTKPLLLKLAKNETSEKVTRPTLVAEGAGYYPEGGVVNVNDNFMFKRYSVNGSRHLKAVGYFFGSMRVCEFDKNGVFICSHRKTGDYTSIEFLTHHKCAYVGIATYLMNGIAADLFDLGSNKAPFPRIMYGVEGVQKNIYNDRFGTQPYGNVYIVPNPSADNANYTRFHNRLEFNVASHSDFSIDVWPSISGKSLFGDDFTPSSSVAVKIKAKANPDTAKNILWVGDSISDYQNTAKYAKEIFDGIASGVAPTFVGTQHTSGTPDESYAGMNTYWLLRNNDSPFRYNSAVDFAHYNSVVGVSQIDLCVMAMGFNDASRLTVSHSNTLAEYKNLYKEFIEKITTANPGIKIVWVLCPFSSKYEKMRDANAHSEGAVMLRNLVLELSYEYTNVVVSDAFYCIDSVNGYPLTEAPIASVYSSLDRTQEFCSDSTHPTNLGCKEWGQNVVGAIIEAFGL